MADLQLRGQLITNREVFKKMSPEDTLESMNDMLIQSGGNSKVCIMNALMSREDAIERCSKYPNNKDGRKCRKCIRAWLKE